MVSRALYNFQAQNYRELSFKKGDLVYIRRQVIWFFDQEYVKLIRFLENDNIVMAKTIVN